jgi:glutamate dehydrogenase (NADP+)
MLKEKGESFNGKRVVISGSGNVAIYAAQKAAELGAKVIAMSDSDGYICDEAGIDLELVKRIKEIRRGRILEYIDIHTDAVYVSDCSKVWELPCDIALPCATQNEINKHSAELLVSNGCIAVAEGANMPSEPDAVEYFLKNGVLFGPAKAADAGGVATSALEMTQNSMRYSWDFEKVDSMLRDIMVNIYRSSSQAAEEYGMKGNLVAGANIAGFVKVADAMLSHGVV